MTSEDEDRWEEVGLVAQRLARNGQWAEAEAAARSIPPADALTGSFHEKVIAFVELGTRLLQAGHRDRATSTLGEAEALAQRLRHGGTWEEAAVLFDIGKAWREAGNAAEALRLWDRCVEVGVGPHTAPLLSSLHRELRAMGEHERAQVALERLPPGYTGSDGSLPE